MPEDNIIHFKPRPEPKNDNGKRRPPPMFNIPPATKFIVRALILIHVIIWGIHQGGYPEIEVAASVFGGFMPANWTGEGYFRWWTPITLLSFSLIHDGWLHLSVNCLMLVALGSGLEKSVGPKEFLLIYVGSTLFAVLSHLAFNPFSFTPIIGASGGVSGVFGAMLYLMNGSQNYAGHKNTFLPIVMVWIGITVIGGIIGAPNGSPVAWIAHIGGFLSGIGLMMMRLERRK